MYKRKIVISKKAGFCPGVKKAVYLAETLSKKYPVPIYTAGPLIHNPLEIKRLSKIGIKPISNIEKIKRGTLIIRTHGLPKDTIYRLKKKNLNIIDATCLFVKRVQQLVENLSKQKYNIIIIGEKNHPEVISLVSYSQTPVAVINKEDEIKNITLKEPIAIVSQTTQSEEKFNFLVSKLKKKYKNLVVFNTICNASEKRQKETEKIARKVDIMLVIGGKNSGNTTRLKEISSKYVKTYHIESKDEIKKAWFKNTKRIGITAGASTPEWVIKDVIEYLKQIFNKMGENKYD
ncbi:MAG: 4-hydroxy-3-methylbut-2-enyl diphosphate reductase [Endomicrobiia bacterium]